MIALDGSVLIAQFSRSDVHHDRATKLVATWAGIELRASPLTLSEVLVGPTRRGTLALAERQLAALGVAEVPFGPQAPRRLAALRATTRLELPDCCVLLAAQDAGADAVATFDDRLAAAAERLGFRAATAA